MKNTFASITAATVLGICGIIATLIGCATTIILANESEAIIDFSFNNDDCHDYVTIDPKSGTIKYNLIQTQVPSREINTEVKYRVAYKAGYQSSYTWKSYRYLTGNNDSTGYRSLVDQGGWWKYEVKFKRYTNIGNSKGTLKLKVVK
ncbi:MAG: hypothetical protein Q4C48_05355 [Lachnospiraceae bacterium]|nr:hypothetical protein [Lachnospiraceae bacterium]